jgi:hypothetical protein
MLLVFASRFQLIELLGSGPISSIVELGVYEGEFALHCRLTLRPASQTLVDHWDYSRYSFVLENAPQNRQIRAIFADYFRGNPEQALQAAYEKVVEQFGTDPNVTICRMDIADAAEHFPDGSADIIYLDGSHTYEYVLRDLYLWYPKLAPGGLFICNDFYESAFAAQQNLGVVPAVQTFAQRERIYPVALSAETYSDFYFSNRPSSELIDRLCQGVRQHGFHAVQLPTELLGSYHHDVLTAADGQISLLPSFCRQA